MKNRYKVGDKVVICKDPVYGSSYGGGELKRGAWKRQDILTVLETDILQPANLPRILVRLDDYGTGYLAESEVRPVSPKIIICSKRRTKENGEEDEGAEDS